MESLLILFLKYPVQGQVKTRLAASVGDVNALLIYQYLVQRTLSQIQKCGVQTELHWAQKQVSYSGFEGYTQKVQRGDSLGNRMAYSIGEGLKSHHRVVLIGSDIPGITSDIINEAFQALDHYDLVLGPASDGGYYLIGMKASCHDIFTLDEWSHAEVLSQTLSKAAKNGLKFRLLDVLNDVDTIEDLAGFPDLQKLVRT